MLLQRARSQNNTIKRARRLRDLNDEINKLMREKGHWEKRIVELGGPDYALTRQKLTDADGTDLATASGRGAGYRYFGAAKNLPGVKELFEKEGPRVLRRSRYDMHKAIDADYYGFRDEDDGVLVREEADAERRIKRQARARTLFSVFFFLISLKLPFCTRACSRI